MTDSTPFVWGTPEPAPTPRSTRTPERRAIPPIMRFEYADPPREVAPVRAFTSRPNVKRSEAPVRKTSRRRRAAAAILAALAITACQSADATPAATGDSSAPSVPRTAVEVAIARSDTLASEVAVAGRIVAVQAIDVRPEVDGRIVAIIAREGEAVGVGAPLFRIDDAELRAQVARAQADRDLARQTLTRTRALLAENASSRADLERAEALERSAQAQLDLLSVRLARTVVRAPFAGVMGRRLVSLGDYVSPQVPLASLQTINPQRVELDVPERYAGALRRGQQVSFAVAAHPGRRFTGIVDFVDPVVALPARTITVKALARNTDGALQAGMFAEARLVTGSRSAAILVPEEALMPSPGGKNAVWVIEKGVAVRREVTVGARRAGLAELRAGVAAGEQVVVGGVLQLGEGAPVQATVVERSGSADRSAPAATSDASTTR